MRIVVVTPAPRGSRAGNRRTATRYASILRELGHGAQVRNEWRGGPCDLLVALHARRSAPSIRAFAHLHPARPLVVVLTGTDLYRDLGRAATVARSLDLATRVVVLQPAALRELAPRWRAKTRVVFQSAKPPALRPKPLANVFEVCVLGHLRPIKDPFRAARAARSLPGDSRIRITHVGRALSPGMAARAKTEAERNPRYRWLGEVAPARASRLLARARLFVQTSHAEGGSSALAEAVVAEVPVVASRIPAAVAMLGVKHPGLFPVGDTRALARLLARAERDAAFLEALRNAGREVAARFRPARERAAWRMLLSGLDRDSS